MIFKKIDGKAAGMRAHSPITCGSDSPSHLPGGRWPLQTGSSLLAAPCLAGKAEEDVLGEQFSVLFINTPEAFNKNTLGC